MSKSIISKKDIVKIQSKHIKRSGRDNIKYVHGIQKGKDEAKKKMIQH